MNKNNNAKWRFGKKVSEHFFIDIEEGRGHKEQWKNKRIIAWSGVCQERVQIARKRIPGVSRESWDKDKFIGGKGDRTLNGKL